MKQKIIIIILGAGVLISLLLNLLILNSLSRIKTTAFETMVSAREGLEQITAEPVIVEVQVDQILPLDLVVPIDETISFPLKLEYPINTVIDTTINLPLLGPQQVAVPIRGVIPIDTMVTIPVKLNLPVSTEYHLQALIPVKISLPPDTLNSIEASLDEIENRLR
jgi:hypothetical protein